MAVDLSKKSCDSATDSNVNNHDEGKKCSKNGLIGRSNKIKLDHTDGSPSLSASPTYDISSCSDSEEEVHDRDRDTHEILEMNESKKQDQREPKETIQVSTNVIPTLEKISTSLSNTSVALPRFSASSDMRVSDHLQKYQRNQDSNQNPPLTKENSILESRIMELEKSMEEMFLIIQKQNDRLNDKNKLLMKTDLSRGINSIDYSIVSYQQNEDDNEQGTTQNEQESTSSSIKNSPIEETTSSTIPPAVEYRCYSPVYEEGLRREIQSRSRSNSVDHKQNNAANTSISNSTTINQTKDVIENINSSNFGNTSSTGNISNNNSTEKLSKLESSTLSGKPPRPPRRGSFGKPITNASSNTELTNTNANKSKATISSTLPLNANGTTNKDSISSSSQPSIQTNTTISNHVSILNYIKTEMLGEGMTPATPKSIRSIQQTDARMEEFLRVPFNLEKLLFFGLAICFDSYLYVLTFLPLKFLWSIFRLTMTIINPKRVKFRFHRRHMYQLLQVSIAYIVYTRILSRIQIGMLYHWIRGQAMIKLYVLIAIVEVFDRLMCAFGQDAQDSLYWNTTTRPKSKRLLISWLVVLVYTCVHSLLLFVHVATLNVAMNSADQALLTLLVSGNFAEIKSTVFKKYSKEFFFNISMSDICERFKLALFLTIILLLNISQGGVTTDMAKNYIEMCSIVLFAEVICDWIKHSFIAKLNFIEASTYREYILVLSRDTTGMGHEGINLDHTHAVVKRTGFAQFPLACVMARYLKEAGRYAWMRSDKLSMLDNWLCTCRSVFMEEQVCITDAKEWELRHRMIVAAIVLAVYLSLLILKIVFGFLLQSYARQKLLNNIEDESAADKLGGRIDNLRFKKGTEKPKRQII